MLQIMSNISHKNYTNCFVILNGPSLGLELTTVGQNIKVEKRKLFLNFANEQLIHPVVIPHTIDVTCFGIHYAGPKVFNIDIMKTRL